jgi:hypothetical protein
MTTWAFWMKPKALCAALGRSVLIRIEGGAHRSDAVPPEEMPQHLAQKVIDRSRRVDHSPAIR